MNASGMSSLPLQVLAMEPVVFFDEYFYVPGRPTPGEAFVRLGGRQLALRWLSLRFHREEREHALRPIFADLLWATLAERRSDPGNDPLILFLTLAAATRHIQMPSDDRWDWPRYSEGVTATDVSAEAAVMVSQFPLPQPPASSLLLLGQIWPLAAQRAARNRLQVHIHKRVLGISDRPQSLASLDAAYRREVTALVEQAADRLASVTGVSTLSAAELDSARRALREAGVIQDGDLILIAGQPPLIGCLLRAHHNTSFGRQCDGDLAVTLPFAWSLKVDWGQIGVSERFSMGRWQPAHPPSGRCWGATPVPGPELSNKPGPALVAVLRLLSERFAQNGKFHGAG